MNRAASSFHGSRVAILVVLPALAHAPSPALAQGQGHGVPSAYADWGRAQYAAVGVLLPAATAVVVSALRGDTAVVRNAVTAAAGGALHWMGKELVSMPDLPPSLGRALGAVGASVAHNGTAGRGALECLSVPYTVLWLNGGRCDDRRSVTLDVGTAIAVLMALSDGARLDVGRSLWTGTAVLGTPALPPTVMGRTMVSGMLYADPCMARECTLEQRVALRDRIPLILSHEMIHVVQHDFGLLVLGRPLDRLLRAAPLPAPLVAGLRFAELGTHVPPGWALLEWTFLGPYLEGEAVLLDRWPR